MQKDLFGNDFEFIQTGVLRQKFLEPPFSILDTRQGSWQDRKRRWKELGIRPEIKEGLDAKVYDAIAHYKKSISDTSIFDPALCELMYNWFCPSGGKILDPFAGASVRGVVAHTLGYQYTGIDIRKDQVDDNRENGLEILPVNNQPQWYCGDSNVVLDSINGEFDFVFSCPPYADLEVYSDIPGDISNMPYDEFKTAYKSIIRKSCAKLKNAHYACFVVSEVRGKNGNYIGFVPETIKAFEEAGMGFYNEIILINQSGSACLRTRQFERTKKVIRTHQNVLVFKKKN